MSTEKINIRPRLPDWIRVKPHTGKERQNVNTILKELHLNTVCESAKCPNLGECWHKKTATFMIMGNECTRNCKFCAVSHNQPAPLDLNEPFKVAEAVKQMGLKYVVITSVTRDDVYDGGAHVFAQTIKEIRNMNGADVKIEVLTPDFNGSSDSIKIVLDAQPTVFNHNVETVERLSSEIRKKATYKKSLEVLSKAVEISNGTIPVKSGIMVGMGETDEEILTAIRDIRKTGASILTIGQYLPPTNNHWKLTRYPEPNKFKLWEEFAHELGFVHVASGPLVRSSYMAEQLMESQLH